jgi:hypothetical protein
MKNLFKINMVGLLALCFTLLAFTSYAQHPTTYPIYPNVNQGEYIDIGGNNMVPRDSLAVTDTATYIIPITHTNDITHYLIFDWQKIGSGTATLGINFYQGNDPTNLNFHVLAGKANANYVKTLTLSASGLTEISFARDTAVFNGRYLKIQMITTSTASVKGKYAIRLKTNIK